MVQWGNNLPLRTKLSLFGVSSVIFLSVGFVYFLNSAIQKTNQSILEERLVLAVVLANQLDLNIHYLEQTFSLGVESLLNNSETSDPVDFSTSDLREFYSLINTNVNQVIWINLLTESFQSYPNIQTSQFQITEVELANRLTIHPTSQLFVIHSLDSASTYIGVPIQDSNNQEFGVILGRISSKKLFNKIQEDLLINRTDIIVDIVDNDGTIILSTDSDRYLKTIGVEMIIIDILDRGKPVIEICANCKNVIQGDEIEIPKIVFAPLTHANGGVIISASHSNTIGDFQTPLINLFLYSLVVLIIILLLAVIFSASLLSPIKDLSRSVDRIANQNIDHQIGFSRQDEFGMLARSIDQMRSTIKKDLSDAQHEINLLSNDLQVVIDSLADDMVIIDRDFRVQLANASVVEKYGGKKPIEGQLCWNINHGGVECNDTGCECPVRQVYRDGLPSRVIHIHPNGNKKPRYVEIVASPIRNKVGEIRGAVELIRDVSEEKWKDNQRKKLFRKVIRAQEEERERIARDLHDEIGQSITAIIMRCGALEQSFNCSEELRNSLGNIRSTASATMQNLRSIMLDLRPDVLDELGLSMAIRALIKERLTSAGIYCQFETNGLKTRLSPLIEITTYRVIQEAITNILKHSQATQATINLCLKPNFLIISIADNGLGFDHTHTGNYVGMEGLGLRSMIERITILNGDLEIETALNAGTHIIVNIPLEEHYETNSDPTSR